MSRYLRPDYQTLQVYTPGEQPHDRKYIKLNTNESPYPPAPSVLSAVVSEVQNLNLYSDPNCEALRKAVAQRYDVEADQVFLSNGSDDILNFAFMAFAGRGGKAYFPDVTYGFYKVFAELHGVHYETIPLKDDFTLCVDDYRGHDGLIVIANPNAPTGLALGLDEIKTLLRDHPQNVVVIDEAYIDFGATSCTRLIDTYSNLLVVQTFSKSCSLAGARLGFALGSKELIDDLNRIKFSTNPYNVNRMTMAAGIAALSEQSYYDECCRSIIEARKHTIAELRKLHFDVTDSLGNFVFAQSHILDGTVIYQKLRDRGILVRHFDGTRVSPYNRITIGTPEQMEALLSALKEILEE
ncbi:MAG: histidinol-phosphate transaminase [Clostridia bacterium]|nr:histidinol-phosphate transaminase [Clostridia bacterium]